MYLFLKRFLKVSYEYKMQVQIIFTEIFSHFNFYYLSLDKYLLLPLIISQYKIQGYGTFGFIHWRL